MMSSNGYGTSSEHLGLRWLTDERQVPNSCIVLALVSIHTPCTEVDETTNSTNTTSKYWARSSNGQIAGLIIHLRNKLETRSTMHVHHSEGPIIINRRSWKQTIWVGQ